MASRRVVGRGPHERSVFDTTRISTVSIGASMTEGWSMTMIEKEETG